MKHLNSLLLVAGLVLTIAISPVVHAQTDYSSRRATTRLTVGAGIALGFALPISVDLPSGDQVAPGLGFTGGLNITYPVSKSVGVSFNAGLDSRGLGKKLSGETDNRIYRATYISLEPGVSFSAFRFSVNIGLPSSISQPDSATGESMEVSSDHLNTLIEPRLGATLVLVNTKDWWLGLDVSFGMMLNQFYADDFVVANDIPAAKAFSGHFGFTWQFAIPGTNSLF